MGIRDFCLDDYEDCVKGFIDAYKHTYYRSEVYSKEGWSKWNEDPYKKVSVYEKEGEVAGVQVEFWNKLGWVEYGALVTRNKFRNQGIGTEFMMRNYKKSIEVLKKNNVNFTIPYNPQVSNGARDINAMFCGVNGIYRINDQRVVFSVYNSFNDKRVFSRIPGYIPEIMREFFNERIKFLKGRYRRRYGFKKLKTAELRTTQAPKLDIGWSISEYLIEKEKKNIIQYKDVKYNINSSNKVVRILDVNENGDGLSKIKDYCDQGYVVDTHVNLASKDAPWITEKLVKEYDFRPANLALFAITIKDENIETIPGINKYYNGEFKTADLLELTTPARRHCILVKNITDKLNDRNVVDYLNRYNQGDIYNPESKQGAPFSEEDQSEKSSEPKKYRKFCDLIEDV
ncbi:MAG: hypothetical protein GF364_07635 [Candidatus Lokiarchaeota archaeon]|nr:hypothetical protein [Candidatus Lokiarchaeota archaeon]